MLQFLYPIGFLAVIGVLIPIVIHLWNIKKGKTLKIGSIALLGLANNQRSTHLRVSDWPLLLLRCLLVLLMASLLAGPIYRIAYPSSEETGWIMVEKQHFGRVWKQHQQVLDSLIKKGYEIHDFNTGFEKIELKDTAANFSIPAALPLSYFSLIKQLAVEKRPGAKIYLYTTNQLKRFEGSKPYTHLDLHWQVFASVDTIDTAAKITENSKLQVLINSKGQGIDASYIRAALYAIAEFCKRQIEIKEISQLKQIQMPGAVVFWLAESPAAKDLHKLPAGITFFNYAGKKSEKLQSVVRYEPGSATQQIALYQRTAITAATGKTIWKDGYGTPLLSLDTSGAIKHYQFYSRFNQNWTEMVWSNGLPEALLPIVIPHAATELGFPQFNGKRLSHIPQPISNQIKTAASYFRQQPLSTVLWWLLLLVFFIERWLTYRKPVVQS